MGDSEDTDPYGQLLIRVYGRLHLYTEELNRQAEVLAAAEAHLKRINFTYSTVREAWLEADTQIALRGGGYRCATNWVVPCTTKTKIIEDQDAFVHLEHYSLELIYVLTPHTYITG